MFRSVSHEAVGTEGQTAIFSPPMLPGLTFGADRSFIQFFILLVPFPIS